MYIAIARMHVQRDPDAALQNALVDRDDLVANRCECIACEDVEQRFAQLAFPRDTNAAILQFGKGLIDSVQQIAPTIANLDEHLFGAGGAIAEHV